jgi:anti-sigma factor RsiW
MNCSEIERLIARYADDAGALSDVQRQHLESHLESCDACRVALGEQRQVARALGARPQVAVPPGFAARVAAGIDAEGEGWLPLANWRAWTAALAPLAAALVFVAWLSGGSGVSSTSPASTQASTTAGETFDTWAISTASSSRAAVFLEDGSGGDALLEAVLTGTSSSGGNRDNDR